MQSHWLHYGRHYYSRHDYEAIPTEIASDLYHRLESLLPKIIGQSFAGRNVDLADNFSYIDPVDNTLTSNQGLRIVLNDGSRVIVRLSGTGTKGATLRVYLESYVGSTGNLTQDPQKSLADLIQSIDSLAEITERTGMKKPTVIT